MSGLQRYHSLCALYTPSSLSLPSLTSGSSSKASKATATEPHLGSSNLHHFSCSTLLDQEPRRKLNARAFLNQARGSEVSIGFILPEFYVILHRGSRSAARRDSMSLFHLPSPQGRLTGMAMQRVLGACSVSRAMRATTSACLFEVWDIHIRRALSTCGGRVLRVQCAVGICSYSSRIVVHHSKCSSFVVKTCLASSLVRKLI